MDKISMEVVFFARRKEARRIAKKHKLDVREVEHVLFNLTMTPEDRLGRSFRRANLKSISTYK